MELYNAIKLAIERGRTDGLSERVDILFALGKLTQEQYEELSAALAAQDA